MSNTDKIKLSMFGLPVVTTLDDFSAITHISKYTLYQLSKNADYHYKVYEIPKKSGKTRKICQPSKKLKGLQSWILVNILDLLKVSNSCKGFEKGSSIATNAIQHVGCNTLLTIDLKDFFPTITSKQVYNVFRCIGYNPLVSVIFSNICTYKGILPQGSPCSPKLANLCALKLDKRIQGFVGKRGINYTRYADDMSFSGLNPNNVVGIIPLVTHIIQDENFILNKRKTRIASKSRAKIVTGLILNDTSFGIGKYKYKLLRAKIFKLTREEEQTNFKLLSHVEGWLNYLRGIDPVRHVKVIIYIKKLVKKHPHSLISLLITKKDGGSSMPKVSAKLPSLSPEGVYKH